MVISPDVFFGLTREATSPQNYKYFIMLGGSLALLFGFQLAWRAVARLPDAYSAALEGGPPVTPAELDGVTSASRDALAATLRQSGFAGAQFDERLAEAVAALARLRPRLADLQPEALALVDGGDFAAASGLLRGGPAPGHADDDAAQRDAELYAQAAVIDRLTLDYRGAAQNYEAAATLASRFSDEKVRSRQEWRLRMEQGRALVADAADKGNAESLEPAILAYDRALSLVPRRKAPRAWAQTQLQRGDALLVSGCSGAEPKQVEEAVSSYRAALEEWSPRATPFEWARAQHNLGDALRRLAEMESGVERLQPAADAYRAALTEWTKEACPDLWAMANGNLADVLASIGVETGDGAKLREAVSVYQAALAGMQREVAPEKWAQMQNRLGAALEALAEQDDHTGIYDCQPRRLAVDAFESALESCAADAQPAQYAATSVSLGESLLSLGEYESAHNPAYGRELAARAAGAFRGALDAGAALSPLEIAKIEINLACALGFQWNVARDDALLDEALIRIEDAIARLDEAGERDHIGDAEHARRTILNAKGNGEAKPSPSA